MKRLFTRLILGCMLLVSVATLTVPVNVNAQTQSSSQLNSGEEFVVGGNVVNPFNHCNTGWTGLGDLGCQIGMFFIYGLWFRITNALAELTAYLADYFLWFSVQSQLYRYGEFMSKGWTIVRNFVNIGFIVALLYTGIQFIIGKGSGAKILLKIILAALLVNFSLFGARLIIDMGNITARAIYTQIKISGVNGIQDQAHTPGQVQISQGIMNISNPQRVLFSDIGVNDGDFIWKMFTMFFMSGILNILLIFIFLSMALLFLTRTISLILLGILVPIPIVVDLIPPVKNAIQKMKDVGSILSFENWLTEYFKLSMMAPIYCFFLYLIVMVQSGYSKIAPLQPGQQQGLIAAVFAAMLPTIITFMLIKLASKITKDFSGVFGAMVTKGITTVLGSVGGFALTGLTRASSLAGGAVGKGLQASAAAGMTPEARAAKLAEDLKGKNFLQRKLLQTQYAADSASQAVKARTGNYLTREATYDPRNIKNTAGFKAFSGSWAGKKLLAETGKQIITDVNFGAAETRSYNDRDTARLKEAEARRAERTAVIHTAMDDHNAREKKRLEAERASRPPDKEKEAELESERRLMTDDTLPANDRMFIDENDDKIKSSRAKVSDINKSIKDITRKIEDPNTSPEVKRDLRNQLAGFKVALKSEEASLKKLEFHAANRLDSTIGGLEKEVTDTESGLKEEKEAIEKEKKEIIKLKDQLSRLKAKAARAERDSKTLTDPVAKAAAKKESEDAKSEAAKLNEEIITRESGNPDKKIDGLKQNEEKLKKREEKIEKTKKIIETREARAKEIQEEIISKSYFKKNDEADVYSGELKALKEQYLKEKNPARKEQILSDINSFSSHVTNVRKMHNDANPNNAFDMVFQSSMLDQNDINKQVASHLIATDMIRDMKNSYANMGRAVAATIAGVATTAAAATLAATTPAMLAAIVTGVAAGNVTDKLIAVQNSPGQNNDRQGTAVGKAMDKVNDAVNASQKNINELTSWFNRSSSMADIEKAFRDGMK